MKTFSYDVEGRTVFDKFEAMATGQVIRFKAPSTYDDYDFSVEPSESLQELLTAEAKKIRDEHRLVRIYYSGGSDSQLMLDTFINNKIHIDEIICLKSGIKEADVEIDTYAIPYLNKINLPDTKVTISDKSQNDYKRFHSMSIEDKIRSNCITWDTQFRLTTQVEYYRPELFDPDVANLHGYDKPKVMKVDGKYYTYFLDGDIEPTRHTYHFFSRNPKLQCKQAHLFINSMKHKNINEANIWDHEKEWNRSIGRQVDNMPSKDMYFVAENNHVLFKGRKMYYLNYKERLALENAVKTMPDIVDKWCTGIDYLRDKFDSKWWNGSPEIGTTGIFSEFYCLEQKSRKTVDDLFPDGFKT